MDRAVGNSESESLELSSLRILKNVPFECIPQGFVEYLKGCSYDYKRYLQACKIYNESGTFWNLVAYDKVGHPIAAVWGSWDPLELHFRVVRISIHPKWMKAGGRFMRWIFREVKLFASEMQAERMYWESDRWKVWVKELGDLVYIDEARVIQAN